MKEACHNCRYVHQPERTTDFFCRRNPPIALAIKRPSFTARQDFSIGFPQVDKDGWCGEYAPQDPEALKG